MGFLLFFYTYVTEKQAKIYENLRRKNRICVFDKKML